MLWLVMINQLLLAPVNHPTPRTGGGCIQPLPMTLRETKKSPIGPMVLVDLPKWRCRAGSFNDLFVPRHINEIWSREDHRRQV